MHCRFIGGLKRLLVGRRRGRPVLGRPRGRRCRAHCNPLGQRGRCCSRCWCHRLGQPCRRASGGLRHQLCQGQHLQALQHLLLARRRQGRGQGSSAGTAGRQRCLKVFSGQRQGAPAGVARQRPAALGLLSPELQVGLGCAGRCDGCGHQRALAGGLADGCKGGAGQAGLEAGLQALPVHTRAMTAASLWGSSACACISASGLTGGAVQLGAAQVGLEQQAAAQPRVGKPGPEQGAGRRLLDCSKQPPAAASTCRLQLMGVEYYRPTLLHPTPRPTSAPSRAAQRTARGAAPPPTPSAAPAPQ